MAIQAIHIATFLPVQLASAAAAGTSGFNALCAESGTTTLEDGKQKPSKSQQTQRKHQK